MLRRRLHRSSALVVLAFAVAPAQALAAIEDNIGSPPPVYPDVADDSAGLPFPTWIMRDAIDKAVTDLLNDETKPFHGKFSLASGSRPSTCGYACFGKPILNRSWLRDNPNERFATIGGHLKFDVEVPNWFNRQVTYFYDIQVGCRPVPGKPDPEARLSITVNPPIPSEPGLTEQIVDFIIPFWDISAGINDSVSESMEAFTVTLPSPEGAGANALRCRSIGVIQSATGNPDSDFIKWNFPRRTPLAGPDQNYTIRLDSVTRKKTAEHAPGADPVRFKIFFNGAAGAIPIEVTLPANGGTKPLNVCRTVPLKGKDVLQILVVDDVPGMDGPGAVWSEFPRVENFGAGPPRKMTTGRRTKLFQSAVSNKPSTGIVREYEIAYTIIDDSRSKFDDVIGERPTEVKPAQEPAPQPKPKKGRFKGKDAAAPKPGAAATEAASAGPLDGVIGERPTEAHPGDAPPPPPCTRF